MNFISLVCVFKFILTILTFDLWFLCTFGLDLWPWPLWPVIFVYFWHWPLTLVTFDLCVLLTLKFWLWPLTIVYCEIWPLTFVTFDLCVLLILTFDLFYLWPLDLWSFWPWPLTFNLWPWPLWPSSLCTLTFWL